MVQIRILQTNQVKFQISKAHAIKSRKTYTKTNKFKCKQNLNTEQDLENQKIATSMNTNIESVV